MRSILLITGMIILSGCAIDPTSTSQLVSNNSAKINALSNINRQLSARSGSGTQAQKSFTACLSSQQNNGAKTLAKYLTQKSDSNQKSPVTITSDSLSHYITALWTFAKQDRKVMLQLLALHRAHDKTCFEKELLSQKNGAQSSSTAKQYLSDYEQSHKILGNVYDYLYSTLTNTEYSELDEQFARDHIPVKVLFPTT